MCRSAGGNEGVGSMLALMTFVLALTLGTATSRLSDRREGAIEETNAIGTAWLQADAIGVEGEALEALIRDYAKARLDFVRAPRNSEQLDASVAATDASMVTIWDEVSVLVQRRNDPVAAVVMESVNDMFDMSASEQFAIRNGLPDVIIRLVLVMTLSGIFGLGLQLGKMGRPHYLLTALLALSWSAIIVTVLDMGTARIGRFGIEIGPYEATLTSMRGEGNSD